MRTGSRCAACTSRRRGRRRCSPTARSRSIRTTSATSTCVGKLVDLPLCDRRIPIIADDFVDREFGSGCVKITGAHDFNDYACALRHGIPLITIFTLDAKINENGPAAVPAASTATTRARRCCATSKRSGFLEKAVPHKHAVPICVRTGEVVEPMLTDQWFVAMTKPGTRRHEHRRQGDRRGRDAAR